VVEVLPRELLREAFLSVAGPDRGQAWRLKSAMQAVGLTVFLDEADIEVGAAETLALPRQAVRRDWKPAA